MLTAEWLNGSPIPVGHVVVLIVEDDAMTGEERAPTTAPASCSRRALNTESEEQKALRYVTIAHEVGHYYWSGNEEWIDEGMADLHAAVHRAIETKDEPLRLQAAVQPLPDRAGTRKGRSTGGRGGTQLPLQLRARE